MTDEELEEIEIALLLEAIFLRYGHDFRHYAQASITRRIKKARRESGLTSISDLIPKILHSQNFWDDMILHFSVNTSDMFRDPQFFKSLKDHVFPVLKTYPSIKIWHAGCSVGQEVYSMAILLHEAGLYEQATIFATDFNDSVIALAQEGIYGIGNAKAWSENYLKAGGSKSLVDYYHADDHNIKIESFLKRNITFANHNLVADQSFGEMNLIICRNVLIYFDKILQNRVIDLFHNSLVHGGILGLGAKESLQFSNFQEAFKPVDQKWKIYKKIH